MGRVILWIILSYIIAKVIGMLIVAVRKMFQHNKPSVESKSPTHTMEYSDVQDVDYQEVNEK